MPYVRLYNLILLNRDIQILKKKIFLDKDIKDTFHKKICYLYSLSLLFELLCSLFSIFIIKNINIEIPKDNKFKLIRSSEFHNAISKSLSINKTSSLFELNNIRNNISHYIFELINKDYEEVIKDIDPINLKEIIKRSLDLVNASEECYILLDCVDELFLVEQNNNPIEKLFKRQNEI